MRRSTLPVAALILTLSAPAFAAAPEAASPKSPAKAAPAKTAPAKPAAKAPAAQEPARTKSELKPVGVPGVKESVLTPEQVKAQQAEWKKLEEKERAERRARREQYKALMATYAREGLDFQKADKPDTYRVIAPSIAKTADAAQRKAAAKALVTRLKGQMEPLLRKKLTLEIYTDAKATQRVLY